MSLTERVKTRPWQTHADCGRGSWRSRFQRLPLPSDPAVRSVENNRELIFEVHSETVGVGEMSVNVAIML